MSRNFYYILNFFKEITQNFNIEEEVRYGLGLDFVGSKPWIFMILKGKFLKLFRLFKLNLKNPYKLKKTQLTKAFEIVFKLFER